MTTPCQTLISFAFTLWVHITCWHTCVLERLFLYTSVDYLTDTKRQTFKQHINSSSYVNIKESPPNLHTVLWTLTLIYKDRNRVCHHVSVLTGTFSTRKMDAADSFKMLITICQTTWRHTKKIAEFSSVLANVYSCGIVTFYCSFLRLLSLTLCHKTKRI